MRRADAQRMEQLKLRSTQDTNQSSQATQRPQTSMNAWQKICPKCRAVLHVRKKVCGCGLAFIRHSPNSNNEDETS